MKPKQTTFVYDTKDIEQLIIDALKLERASVEFVIEEDDRLGWSQVVSVEVTCLDTESPLTLKETSDKYFNRR